MKKRPTIEKISYCQIPSPVGELLLAGNAKGLKLLSFQDGNHPVQPEHSWTYNEKPFVHVRKQLQAYFSGRLRKFTLQLAPEGTPFQLQVWQSLKKIPYGKTVSYGEIAKSIGNPSASRAVGAANGQNPLSIIIPCHRVIGSTGKLVGYGGGLSKKEQLLSLETGS
jgi:methylated-DNA-[protein]-cysteine S-methyltransferase